MVDRAEDSAEVTQRRYAGTTTEDGMVIADAENPRAWILADYEDGFGRSILGMSSDEYDDLIHPYYQQCVWCGEWDDLMMWGAGSSYCPRCEQRMDYLPHKDAEGIDG